MCDAYEDEKQPEQVEQVEATLLLKEEIHCLRYDVCRLCGLVEKLLSRDA